MVVFHLRALCTMIIFSASFGEEPYLLGFRSKEAYLELPEYPEYETHAAPKGPAPEYQATLKEAADAAMRGDYFTAIQAHDALRSSTYLYGRMGPAARYQLHLASGLVLLRAGRHARAEQELFLATSLHPEPHAAYRALALTATVAGRWEEAAGHWKNALFLATSDDSEYLQRLGALLVLSGSVNEGRHYLALAVAQWELSEGPGGDRGKEHLVGDVTSGSSNGGRSTPSSLGSASAGGEVYSWFVEYLLGALAVNWPPHGAYDGEPQSLAEKRKLGDLVRAPSLLDAQGFFDLGLALWDLGVHSASQQHLTRGVAMAQQQLNLTSSNSKSSSRSDDDSQPTGEASDGTKRAGRSDNKGSSRSKSSDAKKGRTSTAAAASSHSALRSLEAMKLRVAFDQAWTPAPPLAPPSSSSKRRSHASSTFSRSSSISSSGLEIDDDSSEWESFLYRLQHLQNQHHQPEAASAEHTTDAPTTAAAAPTTRAAMPREELPQLLRPSELLELFAPIPVIAWRGAAAVAPLRAIARILASYAPLSLLNPLQPLPKPPRDVTQRRAKVTQSSPGTSSSRGGLDIGRRTMKADASATEVVNVVRIGLVSALFCDHDAGFTLLAAARSLIGPAAAARATARTSMSYYGPRHTAPSDDDEDDDDDELNGIEERSASTPSAAAAADANVAAADANAASVPAAPHSTCEFEVTVFAFPTSVDHWSRALRNLAHHYVQLPAGDWTMARRKVLGSRFDAVLWPDALDAASYFLGYHRLAPLQVVLSSRGTPAGLPAADYVVQSEYFEKASASNHAEQLVSLSGLGVPWQDIRASLVLDQYSLSAPLRYEYFGHYFFSSDRVFVVLAPPTQLRHPASDQMLALLLAQDPHAVLVIVSSNAGAAVSASSASLVTSARGGGGVHPSQWHRRVAFRVHAALRNICADPSAAANALGCGLGGMSSSSSSSSTGGSGSSSSPGNNFRSREERVIVLPPLGWSGRLDLLRVADALVDCALPVGYGVHATLQALAMGTPVLTLVPSKVPCHAGGGPLRNTATSSSATRTSSSSSGSSDRAEIGDTMTPGPPLPSSPTADDSATSATAPTSHDSAFSWRPSINMDKATRIEHSFAANFLLALFRNLTHGNSSHDDVPVADNSAGRNDDGSNSTDSSFQEELSDAQSLAALVVEMPDCSCYGNNSNNFGDVDGAAAAFGAAWVRAAAQLSDPEFRLAVRRALAQRLETWTLGRSTTSTAAVDLGLADFMAVAVASQRSLQRKGLV